MLPLLKWRPMSRLHKKNQKVHKKRDAWAYSWTWRWNSYLHLSHSPANRNECSYCKHILTSPANTSTLSLSLKNHNFKFVTLTRAASQPVALFFLGDFWMFLLISVKFGEWISGEIFETCCLYVCAFLIFHQKIRALTWFKHELSRFYKNHGFAAASKDLFDSYFHQVGGCEVTGTAPRRLANRCCGCVNRSIRLQWSCGLGWCWNEDHPAWRS